ncbi:hypothetical protein Q8A67_009528 [Cirrhinus molitorella]|uniref:non-specific serine/threonine protein kinase n=1 Tax=Cirrhinus molitorella TaxID=172907 RepID=A0AA88TPM6_9TELE|nr:hypothetical protein Q8A67_009528 [Cirrhinus molitorella]
MLLTLAGAGGSTKGTNKEKERFEEADEEKGRRRKSLSAQVDLTMKADERYKQEISEKDLTIAQLEESNKTLTKDVEILSKEKTELNERLQAQEKEFAAEKEELANTIKANYEKALNIERTLKTQAVNKLAEIMNRKDMKLDQKMRGSTTDLRKKEKENRKLQLDLNQEKEKFNHMAIKYQKELNEMQAAS